MSITAYSSLIKLGLESFLATVDAINSYETLRTTLKTLHITSLPSLPFN